jgi:hypothetical protein
MRGRASTEALAQRWAMQPPASEQQPGHSALARMATHRDGRPAGSRRTQTPRHCWVVGCPDVPGRQPGLLIGWDRSDSGTWRGHVVIGVPVDHGTAVMTLWVNGEYLRPAREG